MLTTKGDPWVSSPISSLDPLIMACTDWQNPPEKDIKTCTQEITEALRSVARHPRGIHNIVAVFDDTGSSVNAKARNLSSESWISTAYR